MAAYEALHVLQQARSSALMLGSCHRSEEGLLLRDYAQAQLEQNARGGHALPLLLHRAPVPWAPSVPVSPRANGVEIERQRLGIGRHIVVLAVFNVASSPAP